MLGLLKIPNNSCKSNANCSALVGPSGCTRHEEDIKAKSTPKLVHSHAFTFHRRDKSAHITVMQHTCMQLDCVSCGTLDIVTIRPKRFYSLEFGINMTGFHKNTQISVSDIIQSQKDMSQLRSTLWIIHGPLCSEGSVCCK